MSSPRHVPGYWRRHSAAFLRWLHIYLSMVSFGILFFFALTGITLNHAAWFDAGATRSSSHKGRVNAAWVGATDPGDVQRLEIVESLRAAHAIRGALGEFNVYDDQCMVSFRGPGYTADVAIDRATGNYELTETRMGFVAVLNDLHKGRDTGAVWSAVIDLSAGLMILVSLTGFALIFYLRRRRRGGLTAMVVGGLACLLVYLLLVP
ncbi:MAG: PepSY-associated TM helix domain-containing protein [Verrucomicrobiales bacterium]|nr:PepSY-associated TM helix domain-containing protein [Verrucomicrobiales bacterium]